MQLPSRILEIATLMLKYIIIIHPIRLLPWKCVLSISYILNQSNYAKLIDRVEHMTFVNIFLFFVTTLRRLSSLWRLCSLFSSISIAIAGIPPRKREIVCKSVWAGAHYWSEMQWRAVGGGALRRMWTVTGGIPKTLGVSVGRGLLIPKANKQ